MPTRRARSSLPSRHNEQAERPPPAVEGMVVVRPRAPILVVVDGGDDVLSFETAKSAEGWVEPPEVEAGAYAVFDADGRRGRLAIERWDVRISDWEPPTPESLRSILTSFLSQHGVGDSAGMSLPELVATTDRVAREIEDARTHPRWLAWLLRRRGARRTERESG
jgi:hypothetical protein